MRPKATTVAVIIAGLAPIMWSEGTGAEVMQRIAAPMIGGMTTAPLLSMVVIPAAYYLLRRRRLWPASDIGHGDTNDYIGAGPGKTVVTSAD